MANAYSEYSRLRSIARKRGERLESAGLGPGVSFPTVKQIKQEHLNINTLLRGVTSYLTAPTTVKEVRKLEETQRPVFIPTVTGPVVAKPETAKIERQRARSRESSRRYRERVKQLTKKEKSYMKAARTLGLHITPSMAKAFGEYMATRFSQSGDVQKYQVARYVEDFQSIIARPQYKPEQLTTDFAQFVADQMALAGRSESMAGLTPMELDDLWQEYADELDY